MRYLDRLACHGLFRHLPAGLACGAALAGQAAGQPEGLMRQRSEQGMRLGMAIANYASSHENILPPDLGATLDGFLNGADAPAEVVRKSYLGPDAKAKDIPAEPDGAWVNEHASFAYLAGGGINWNEVPDWGGTVIAHLKMDEAAEAEPGNAESAMVALMFPDCHLEWATPAEAARRIDESTRIFEAIRTGGAFPERLQAEWNLRTIAAAIRGYATAHDGMLPPDLGATLPHLPEDPKRLAGSRQRASVYLSVRDAGRTAIPDEPTPEWVNRNTSYTYLGNGEVRLADVEDPQHTVLVHAELRDGIAVTRPGGVQTHLFTIATLGNAANEEEEYAAWIVRQSEDLFKALGAHEALPDYYADCRDVRLLARGVLAYAAANRDTLPPDLGAVREFVSDSGGDALSGRALAAVFVNARAEHAGALPDDPTPDWIAQHGSYTLLGAGSSMSEFRRTGIVLIHAPLADTHRIRVPNAEIDVVPFAESRGIVTTAPPSSIQQMIDQASKPPGAGR